VIAYCLTHDLVEIFAGDTYFYTTNKKIKDSKRERETNAMKKIAKLFPAFSGMNKTISDYETKKDIEASFVYAVDKVLPVLNIFLDKGRSWQRDRVTYELIRTKDEKVKISEPVEKIWKDLVERLDRNKKFFYEK
jgi:putative hydrolase of HD superfamily